MNIFKDPQYAPLKAVLIIVVFIGLGAFALKASRSNSLEQTGQVIDGKPVMLTTLKTGVRNNSEVKALQTFLTKNKLFAGKIDGNFGKDTEEAVKKFQNKYTLKPTGTFGQSWKNENPSLMPPGDEAASCGIDFNEDGVTDVLDLDMLMASFGSVGDNLSADLDNDQVVGASDIVILMGVYGTSANCMLTVSLTEGADAINQAHIIEVDSTQDTDEVSLLAFTLENQGEQDFFIDNIPLRLISTETTGNDPDDIATSVYLTLDGEVLDEITLTPADSNDSTETVVFDNLDMVLPANESRNFVVKVDVGPTSGSLDNGDTLRAEINDEERDGIDVENEEGDALLLNQRTGTAIGEASELRDIGILLNQISIQTSSIPGSPTGVFTITFGVTAFGDDIVVDNSQPNLNGTVNTSGTDESDLNLTSTGTGTLDGAFLESLGGATQVSNGFIVEEGDTEQFQITALVTATTDGFFKVGMGNLVFALSNVDGTEAYTINMDEFETNNIFLDAN